MTPKERIGLGTNSILDDFSDVEGELNFYFTKNFRVFLKISFGALGLAEDHKDLDWERLRRRFEDGLAPAEKKVSDKLKTQIADAKNSAAMAEEFRRYRGLIKREGIKRELRSEREALLLAYNHLVGRIFLFVCLQIIWRTFFLPCTLIP